jgi:hypothetical protein
MKWDQEVEEKWAHACLSTNWFLMGFAAHLDIIGIKLVEDLEIFFEASADLGAGDGVFSMRSAAW